jgi:hypothetical protein
LLTATGLKDGIAMLEELEDAAVKALRNGHVPIELRNRNALELLSYLYPKLKAVEHSGTVAVGERKPDEFSDELLASIVAGTATEEDMRAFLLATGESSEQEH